MADEEKKEGKEDKAPAIDPAQFVALQESIAKLEAKNKELLQEKSESRKAAEKAVEEAARKNGDVEALEKSWREKHESGLKELSEQLTGRDKIIYGITAASEARRIAEILAVDTESIEALIPHIQPRLSPEIKDGTVSTRVLGGDGKPSAMSPDDLMKEISSQKHLARLIKGSSASGSGGVGGKGSAGSKTMSRSDFDALDHSARKAFIKDSGGKVVD